jgi:hypothetical protein
MSGARARGVLVPHAQPFGSVHLVAHEMHESPHAHSGQTMQQPVEPSLQLVSSSVTAAGHSQITRIPTRRSRALTAKIYTRLGSRERGVFCRHG